MVKEQKYFTSGLEAAIASRAETIGLVRDYNDLAHFAGYLKVGNEDGSKELYLIAVKPVGVNRMVTLATKSDNVIKQINELMEQIGNEPRETWAISFSETKTRKGNNVIIVNASTVDA